MEERRGRGERKVTKLMGPERRDSGVLSPRGP